MRKERQAILSLLALGRITPRETEHLLAGWDAGREEFWMIAACVLACLAEFLPALARFVHILLPEGFSGRYHAVAAITCWMGGVL